MRAADTLLLTVPNQLGVEYNARMLETIARDIAPAIGWRARSGYDRRVSRLGSRSSTRWPTSWPPGPACRSRVGGRRGGGQLQRSELGSSLSRTGRAELPFLQSEAGELIEHGDAEPADTTADSAGVSHDLHGPSDVTEVLELFDRRYRDVRGEDAPYSSEDAGFGGGVPPDQSPPAS